MDSAESSELRVVHALRLKGFADTDVIAEAAGSDAATAQTVLETLAEAERARYREGRMTGWMLTSDGRAHGEALLAAELDAGGKREAVDACYRRFLQLNQGFLGLCTDWQTREVDGERIVNEHDDAAYDESVISRLSATNDAIQPIVTDLAGLLDRFGSYSPRYAEALSKVASGELEWFTKPVIDSYHTVWFELHEDLLATLGIERASEAAH